MRAIIAKKITALFIAGIFLFALTDIALAENINMGSFSEQAATERFSNDIELKVNKNSFTFSSEDIKKLMQSQEILIYNPKYLSEIENTDFCGQADYVFCRLSVSATDEAHIQKISSVHLDTDSLAKYLDELSQKSDKDPQNATLQMGENGKVSVFTLSSDGIRLDKEKSLQILADYFKNSRTDKIVELPFNIIKPAISTDTIDNLGITKLIGEGTSNFAGSPKNRIHNIKVGTQKFNGVLIKPDEEFSFLDALGPVDASTGYLPELVIKHDKTEPDYGGGMCQVSTTAFRAAIYSGLKITSRTPHAYPVQYYNPQGMDATVFIPAPDLRFINNTSGYILIQTRISGTQLTFDFYGTDDGRKITVIGPTITERNSDGSMKATFTQQVTDKDGNMFINQAFNSAYDSPSKYPHPGQVLTEKPKDWSKREWEQYKKDNHL